MNAISDTESYISPSAKIHSQVNALIPEFQKFCLQSDYDVVIPIESEGFALLWPELQPIQSEKPRVIPSSVMMRAKAEDINEKRVLIVDASTYSGETIARITKQVSEHFRPAKVDIASMIIFKDVANDLKFANDNRLVLSQNRYDWARESIVEYISSHVFMHFGDPPLWGFRYLPEERSTLFDALEKTGTFYALPGYSDDLSDWIRYSVDNIQLCDKQWLPKQVEPEEFIKIRLFIHKTEPIFLVLPLFFPIVPKNIDIDLVEMLEGAADYFPPEFDAIIDFSKRLGRDPYLCLRWISTIGSMLLLRDLYRRLVVNGVLLNFEEPFLKGPIPNLRNYSCSADVLLAFENVMRILLQKEMVNSEPLKQLPLPDSIFSFEMPNEIFQYQYPLDPEFYLLPPEQYLGAVIGYVSSNEFGKRSKVGDSPDFPTTCEFTLSELSTKAKHLTRIGLNRALDVLVDESVMNLCFKEDSDNRIHRGYYVGGESKRRILETLGYAFEEIIVAKNL